MFIIFIYLLLCVLWSWPKNLCSLEELKILRTWMCFACLHMAHGVTTRVSILSFILWNHFLFFLFIFCYSVFLVSIFNAFVLCFIILSHSCNDGLLDSLRRNICLAYGLIFCVWEVILKPSRIGCIFLCNWLKPVCSSLQLPRNKMNSILFMNLCHLCW